MVEVSVDEIELFLCSRERKNTIVPIFIYDQSITDTEVFKWTKLH